MVSSAWGSDVPVSMPSSLPLDTQYRVPMYGFVFTEAGLFHDLSEEDVHEIRTPTYAPSFDPMLPVIYGDLFPE